MSKFSERGSKVDCLKAEIKPLSLTPSPYNWHIQYLDEAIECFRKNLPISCIIVSSALVETCLSWEKWRRKPEEQRIHITIREFRSGNLTTLFHEFIDSDIPLNKLLDTDELKNLGELKKEGKQKTITPVRYIMVRNKFAHGDLFHHIFLPATLISGHEKDWLDYGIDDYSEWLEASLEIVAYVQLLKTMRFIKAFTDFLLENEDFEGQIIGKL